MNEPEKKPESDANGAQRSDFDEKILELKNVLNEVRGKIDVFVKTVSDKRLIVSALENKTGGILARESEINSILKKTAESERSAQGVAAKQKIEKDRWLQMEEWYAIENEKWQAEDAFAEAKNIIETGEKEIVNLKNLEADILSNIAEAEIEKAREESTAVLRAVLDDRMISEKKSGEFREKLKNIEKSLENTRKKEQDVEKEENGVEDLLTVAKSLSEERELAKKRYLLEKERHEIEVSRWKEEEEAGALGKSAEQSEQHLSILKQKEEEVRKKLRELDEAEKSLTHAPGKEAAAPFDAEK